MRSAGVDGETWADFGPWPTREGFLVVSDGGSCAAVWRDGMARWRGEGDTLSENKMPAETEVFSFLYHEMEQLRSTFASETI